jgi:hypothetical protein
LVLKKSEDGKAAYSQTLYLKEEEVKAHAMVYSGEANLEEMRKLRKEEQDQMSKELVRVDNVFYASHLKNWVSAFYPELLRNRVEIIRKENELHGRSTKKITVPVYISDLVPLFSSRVILREMINSMKNELGLRTILFAPTLDRIQALRDRGDFGERGNEMVDKWVQTDVHVKHGEEGSQEHLNKEHSLVWEKPWEIDNKADHRVVTFLRKEFCLDLSLPYEFYTLLDEARISHRASFAERKALGHAYLGFRGTLSLAGNAPDIILRLKKELRAELLDMKSSVALTLPRSKKAIAKELSHELANE